MPIGTELFSQRFGPFCSLDLAHTGVKRFTATAGKVPEKLHARGQIMGRSRLRLTGASLALVGSLLVPTAVQASDLGVGSPGGYMEVGPHYNCGPAGYVGGHPGWPGLRDGIAEPGDYAYTLMAPITTIGGYGGLSLCGWLTKDALGTPNSPNCSAFGGRSGQGRAYSYTRDDYLQFTDLSWGSAVTTNLTVDEAWAPYQQAIVTASGRYERVHPGGLVDDRGDATITLWLQYQGHGACWNNERGQHGFTVAVVETTLVSEIAG